jgi:hypothetical protein
MKPTEIDSKEGSNLPENLTLRQIFDRDKVGALENALKLAKLIREIGLDEWFGDVEATDDNRPMPALQLAHQLCDQLLILEYLKDYYLERKLAMKGGGSSYTQ